MATITQLQTRILNDISEQSQKISYGSATDSHVSMNTAGIYGVSPSDTWLGLECTSDGKLKCDTTIDTSGLATDSNQSTIIGHLDGVEGKLDTLESGKSTSALQTTGNASLTSIDGKISACDTSSLSTEATLSSLNGKVSQGSDTQLSTAQQVLVYGRDSQGNLDALKTDQQGHLEIVLGEVGTTVVIPSIKSASTSTESITTTASGTDTSSSIDMDGFSRITFVGTITDTTDALVLQGSIDSTNWFDIESYFPTFTSGSVHPFHVNVPESALRYLRLSRTDTSTSTQTWEIRTSKR